MLQANYKEGKTNVIEMPDVNVIALDTFLSSMYNGYVVDEMLVNDVLVLADKYRIDWMKVSQFTL